MIKKFKFCCQLLLFSGSFNNKTLSMLTIEKFLWCLELETGVNLIGYFGIFSSLVLAIAFLLTSAFNYEEVLSYIKERLIVHHKTDVPGIR